MGPDIDRQISFGGSLATHDAIESHRLRGEDLWLSGRAATADFDVLDRWDHAPEALEQIGARVESGRLLCPSQGLDGFDPCPVGKAVMRVSSS